MSSNTSTSALLKRTFSIWSYHNATTLAAAVSYYTMLSLAPLLVIALMIVTLIYGHKAEAQLNQQVNSLVSSGVDGNESPAIVIQQMLHRTAAQGHHGKAAVISFIIAVISGSSLFAFLQSALNTIWDIQPRPSASWKAMIFNRLTAAATVLVLALLLIGSFAVSGLLRHVMHAMGHWVQSFSFIVEAVISLAIVTLMFAVMFKFLPDAKMKWKNVWLGAILTAVLFVIGKIGLSLYFRYVAVVSPYGAAGSLAALLIWVYYSALLIFLGAAFTRAYAERYGEEIRPASYAQRVAPPRQPEPVTKAQTIPDYFDRSRGRRVNQMPEPERKVSVKGLMLGAIAGGVGAWVVGGKERRIRAEAEKLRLPVRLEEAERKLRAAGRVTHTLERFGFRERIDEVERKLKQVAREARHP